MPQLACAQETVAPVKTKRRYKLQSDIPVWVQAACRLWGRQKRRMWAGHDWHGNVDGYAQSLLGRIHEERDGTWQGQRSQHWPEVFHGDGLEVQRSLLGMAERMFAVIHFQYVWDPEWGVTATQKATFLEIARSEYFEVVEKAEAFLHGRMESRAPRPDSQIAEEITKLIQRVLQTATVTVTTAPRLAEPCLNLPALQRPLLQLRR